MYKLVKETVSMLQLDNNVGFTNNAGFLGFYIFIDQVKCILLQ